MNSGSERSEMGLKCGVGCGILTIVETNSKLDPKRPLAQVRGFFCFCMKILPECPEAARPGAANLLGSRQRSGFFICRTTKRRLCYA